jgi:4-azaleucine resistance transporter AzlC
MRPVHRQSFLLGMRHMTPLLLGAFPFGLFLGVTVAESSIADWAGFLSGLMIFGGSAQLVAFTLMGEGAPPVSVVSAALVVNARHLMYSAAMVPRFRNQPPWFRRLGPFVLIDQVFALCSVRDDEPERWRSYYLGVGIFALSMWMVAMGAGILLGSILPDGLGLEFGIPILFLGLMVPAITRRPPLVAALTAVAVATLTAGVPNRGGILIGGAAGMIAGALADRRSE